MHTRRSFLQSVVGAAALASLPRLGAAQEQTEDINCTLQRVSCLLHDQQLVVRTVFRPVPRPTKGLVQYRWAHYYPYAEEDEMMQPIQEANMQLVKVMRRVHAMPDAGFDALMHEGLVKGREQEMIECNQETHRELMRSMFAKQLPIEIIRIIPPSDDSVQKEMANEENLERETSYVEKLDDDYSIRMRVSPLARLGAGYVLWRDGVPLDAAEDPAIDDKAFLAFHGDDEAEFKKWVFEERDKNFVDFIDQSPRRITHLLLGANHDLTDDLANSEEQISHLIVTVQGVLDAEKREAELRIAHEKKAIGNNMPYRLLRF